MFFFFFPNSYAATGNRTHGRFVPDWDLRGTPYRLSYSAEGRISRILTHDQRRLPVDVRVGDDGDVFESLKNHPVVVADPVGEEGLHGQQVTLGLQVGPPV